MRVSCGFKKSKTKEMLSFALGRRVRPAHSRSVALMRDRSSRTIKNSSFTTQAFIKKIGFFAFS